jgi:crotonobetainyl-CoA:carnitine CoA-transferase CaiB-like acyl-CoA transferase
MVFSATPAHVTAPGPSFGQHNDEILRDILGLDDEVIDLVASGALD